jgi:hypothetical protein
MYLDLKKRIPGKLLQLPFFCFAFSPKRRRLLAISNLFSTDESSISVRKKPHFGRSEEELPEVTSPEAALTGNDVTGSGPERK